MRSNKASKSLKDGSVWPRGKVLGGCGTINAMIYLRGFPEDFNEWAAMGNPGWDYESVLPYFKKSEDQQDPDKRLDARHHGIGGPLKVGHFKTQPNPVQTIFLEAAKELGYPVATDFNGHDRLGFAYVQGTIADGTRQSTAKAFLSGADVMNRPNLKVIKHAEVKRLQIETGDHDSVTGLRFEYQGTAVTVNATKEVILSAGVINTPQILIKSGIGPRPLLANLHIDVVQDLPVGRNLKDHVFVPLYYRFAAFDEPVHESNINANSHAYLHNKSGQFAEPPIDLIGFINTKGNASDLADIEVIHNIFPAQAPMLRFFMETIGYNDEIIQTITEVNKKALIGVVWLMVTRPKSTGTVELNEEGSVRIDPNYLDHEDDLQSLIGGISIYDKLPNTAAFRETGGELIRLAIPECDLLKYGTIAYWECYCRHLSSTLYHPVGTARMGPSSDPTAVVDYNTLKVHGFKGLRIIDASVMPNIVGANTNAATIMIAERGADLIKGDYE